MKGLAACVTTMFRVPRRKHGLLYRVCSSAAVVPSVPLQDRRRCPSRRPEKASLRSPAKIIQVVLKMVYTEDKSVWTDSKTE